MEWGPSVQEKKEVERPLFFSSFLKHRFFDSNAIPAVASKRYSFEAKRDVVYLLCCCSESGFCQRSVVLSDSWFFLIFGMVLAIYFVKLLTPVGKNRWNGGHLFKKRRSKDLFFFLLF